MVWYLKGNDLKEAQKIEKQIFEIYHKAAEIAFGEFIDYIAYHNQLKHSSDLLRKLHYEYITHVNNFRVEVCLRGKWWMQKDNDDPLGLYDVMFPDCDAMINVEIHAENTRFCFVWHHKAGEVLWENWKEEII